MTETPHSKWVKRIRGLPFPNFPWFTDQNVSGSLDHVPRDGDVIIASYPKTGTTWLQYIVHQVVTRGQTPPSLDDMTYKVIPFVDKTGVRVIDDLPGPRIYKHHLPYDVRRKSAKAKYLYIHRSPGDVVVSYYHFMQGLMEEDLDFDAFFEGFLSGNVGYGRYFEHVLSYLELARHQQDVLLISYEKLRSHTRDEVLRIAEFLGREHFDAIAKDGHILEKILKHTSFEYMKRNLSFVHPRSRGEHKVLKELNNIKTVNFFRKGDVGEGRKTLKLEQLNRMNELMTKLMKGTDVIDEWQDRV